MKRVIIIDDEIAGIETLKILAQRNQDKIKVVASTTKPQQGISLVEDYQPDVVFLDVHMADMNGFQLLEQLQHHRFKVVFTTAHQEYAIKAIKHGAFDYLLKPFSEEEFVACVDRLLNVKHNGEQQEAHSREKLLDIPVKDGVMYLRQSDIVRLEADRSYTSIYMADGIKHIASKSLSELAPRLCEHCFLRVHKSHVINLRKVVKFVNHNGCYALMSDGSAPDISRVQKEEFLDRMKDMRH